MSESRRRNRTTWWRPHVFDCYSPTPGKAVRGVWTEVSGKVTSQQTQRVVLNLQDWRGDLKVGETEKVGSAWLSNTD